MNKNFIVNALQNSLLVPSSTKSLNNGPNVNFWGRKQRLDVLKLKRSSNCSAKEPLFFDVLLRSQNIMVVIRCKTLMLMKKFSPSISYFNKMFCK